jgi:hypothetical protein
MWFIQGVGTSHKAVFLRATKPSSLRPVQAIYCPFKSRQSTPPFLWPARHEPAANQSGPAQHRPSAYQWCGILEPCSVYKYASFQGPARPESTAYPIGAEYL